MKFMHIADLHLGKIVNEFNMIHDQKHVLKQMLDIVKEKQIEGVLIAGDVYDRAIPPLEAVEVLSSFLSELTALNCKVFLVAGNHDSGERLGFGKELFRKSGVYIAGRLEDYIEPIPLMDEYGPLSVTLLPFFKPAVLAHKKEALKDNSYEAAIEAVIRDIPIRKEERNILVTHHFVTSKTSTVECSDSENQICVGGADNVDSHIFDGFDYVALGHIHGPQKVGREMVRYCGSPLKYSFSEEFHHKSVVILDIKEKGEIKLEKQELIPLHDMRRIKGKLSDLISDEVIKLADPMDYLGVTLTDEEEILDPIGVLRRFYPNVMQITFEKNKTNENEIMVQHQKIREKSPQELVEDFFTYASGRQMDQGRKDLLKELYEKAEERMAK